ncbi:MAG TPA: hypothetical protein VII74_01245 [Chthoniobacterales bacterium]
MKSSLLCLFLAALTTSCTTLSNRRDLYNPSEDAGTYNTLAPAHAHEPGATPAPLPSLR